MTLDFARRSRLATLLLGGAVALTACQKPAAAPASDAAPATTAAAPVRTPPQQVARTAAAFRPTMTAVELASAFKMDKAGAEKQFGKQPLLATGILADVDANTGVAHMKAGDFPAVQLRDLKPEFAATLKADQQVILACDGATWKDGTVVADHCAAAP